MSDSLKETSDSLIFGERPEQFAHGCSFIFGKQPERMAHCCSFLVSDLSDSLTSIIFGE